MKINKKSIVLAIVTVILGLVQSKIQDIQIRDAVSDYFKENPNG